MNVLGGGSEGLPAPGRYDLPLLSSHRESPTVMTFRFSTEGTHFRYLSNQFVRLSLPEVADPWGPARSFSLSSSPTERGFIAVTCKISDTPFKQALAAMAPGDRAVVYGPLGSFLLDQQRPAVFLAGGIGITPLRGMIRFAQDRGLRNGMVLLYSARTPEELVFRSELDEIAAHDPHLTVEYSVTRPREAKGTWSGRTGRINEAWIREATSRLHHPRYYVCGLPEMVRDLVLQIQGPMGVPESDVDYEVFRGF